MADLVGSFDDVGYVIGDGVDFAVSCLYEAVLLELLLKEFVERTPVRFADEEHWHFWHFAFLHKDENFGKFIKCAEAAREEDIDLDGVDAFVGRGGGC